MKRYKLKYKIRITSDGTVVPKLEYFRTYHFAYKKFKKLITDQNVYCAYIDKFDKETNDYSNPINNYAKYARKNLRGL